MSSMFCNRIYTCKNSDWCARDFKPKTYGCYEVMTHYDEIMKMSIEELAEWLCDVSTWLPLYEGKVHPILEWLNSPKEDEA